MRTSILLMIFTIQVTQWSFAQKDSDKQEIINLSKEKWQLMPDKKVDKLDDLFHENAMFVHMGGNMNKEQELNVIKSGEIHYKHTKIQETSVQFIGNTAILLTKSAWLLGE